MLVKKLFDEYLDYCEIYRKKGTYLYYKKNFKSLLKALEFLKINHTSEFTKKSLDDLVMYYKKQTKKKNSKINDTISTLYTVLNKNEVTSLLPKRILLIDDTTSFRPLNDQDLDNLMKYLGRQDLNESNNLIWVFSVYLMLDTGVRLNELVNIKTENVDLFSRKILLSETKNSRKRMVSYGVLTESLIGKVYDTTHSHLLWNRLQNGPLQKRSLEHYFKKLNQSIEFSSSLHAHRLRKTFATRLLRMGCPLTTIQKLLGHRSITQTMVYLEVDNEMIDKDYRKFYPF